MIKLNVKQEKKVTSILDTKPIELSETIVDLYSQIAEVEAIYQQQLDDVTNIWVFTNNTEYNFDLMEKLISQELLLINKLPTRSISVRHVPSVLYSEHQDVTGSAASLIYKR